jgi:hypothetical protein
MTAIPTRMDLLGIMSFVDLGTGVRFVGGPERGLSLARLSSANCGASGRGDNEIEIPELARAC